MIVLSKWTTSTLLGNHPVVMDSYPNCMVLGDSPQFDPVARIAVLVTNPPAALAADYLFPAVPSATYTVEDYRSAMRASHDIRLKQLTVAVVVNALNLALPANLDYQDYLAALAAEYLAGAATLNVQLPGGIKSVTALTFRTAYLAYRAGLRSLNGVDHLAIHGAIMGATQATDLDAVTIG